MENHLYFDHTVSSQKLDSGKPWEQGYHTNSWTVLCKHSSD